MAQPTFIQVFFPIRIAKQPPLHIFPNYWFDVELAADDEAVRNTPKILDDLTLKASAHLQDGDKPTIGASEDSSDASVVKLVSATWDLVLFRIACTSHSTETTCV
jgi:hypothetical protein